MSRAMTTPADAPSPIVGRITDRDILAVRRQRDRHVQFGGAWQSWQRILDVLEDAKLAQDEIEQAAGQDGASHRPSHELQRWLTTGGTA